MGFFVYKPLIRQHFLYFFSVNPQGQRSFGLAITWQRGTVSISDLNFTRSQGVREIAQVKTNK